MTCDSLSKRLAFTSGNDNIDDPCPDRYQYHSALDLYDSCTCLTDTNQDQPSENNKGIKSMGDRDFILLGAAIVVLIIVYMIMKRRTDRIRSKRDSRNRFRQRR